MLFATGGDSLPSAVRVDFLATDQITPQDRELATDADAEITERARAAGFRFDQDKWNSQQIVCSALPNHLFMQFKRSGNGSESILTASIPRGGQGQVRIVPIMRRGYSLFSPAPINAQTVSVFNHIRDEEHPEKAPEWLATGLCYAALAGARPSIESQEESKIQKLPAAPSGGLTIQPQGGAVIFFTDLATLPRLMQWTMTFDGHGKLLKAAHFPAPKSKDKVRQTTPAEVQGKPVR
jgi:hypothetical protein